MAEQNLLAYFRSPEEAEAAAKKLQALRAADVQVDRFGRYPGDGVEQVANPLTSDFSSLGNLTLAADFSNKSAAILAAADPGASGMSDGGQGEPTGYDILLTAVVDASIRPQAERVIRESGGQI